jgi:hypothetical protein
MPPLSFRKADPHRYAVAFLELAATITAQVPRPQRRLADHLLRAALSLPVCIAAAHGRGPPDAHPYQSAAEVSALTCVVAVDALRGLRAVEADDAARALELLTRVVAMLSRSEGSR